MKHHKSYRTLGRDKDQRKALMRSLARSLFLHGKIVTTEPKAKEVRPFAEKLMTKAISGTPANKRLIEASIGKGKVADMLVETIAPKYKGRNGGYTRIIKMPTRVSDRAKMSTIELV
ncbi:MAG: 50S ribosomal protein L17 [Candidatus Pacebacteria bacterium]|nr:50S ribosomal protein L17 [Candidatus Paceibacterota bacterium]